MSRMLGGIMLIIGAGMIWAAISIHDAGMPLVAIGGCVFILFGIGGLRKTH